MQMSLMAGAAAAFTFGGVLMKWSDGMTRGWYTAAFLLCFAAGAVAQAAAMRGQEMGTVYLVVVGLECVFAFALGAVVFGEPINLSRVVAAALVTSGVVLLRA
jgi:multidrug transporter EmrE-like cation transporter